MWSYINKKHYLIPCVLCAMVCADIYVAEANKIYILNKYKSGIYVIEETNYKIIKTIPAETVSASMIAATNDRLYFIEAGVISVFDKTTFTKLNDYDFNIFLAPGLGRAIVSPDQKYIYIGAIGWGRAEDSGVFIIDIKTGKTTGVLEKNKNSTGLIGLTKNGEHIFIPEINTIKVVRPFHKSIIDEITLNPADKIQDIVIYGNDVVYTAINSSEDPKYKLTTHYANITKINIRNKSKVKINLPERVFRILLHPKGDRLFVLGKTVLIEIDTSQNAINKTAPIDGDNMAISKDGKKIYVISSTQNQMIIWDIEKGTIIDTLNIGEEPYEILVD